MLLRSALQLGLLIASAPSTWAASSWGFSDATVSIQTKGAGVGQGLKETYVPSASCWSSRKGYGANISTNRLTANKPLPNELSLGGSDTMKIVMTTKDGSSAKMPHQAFLLLKDTDTGLDYSYPFSVKDSGKAKVELVRPGSN